MNPNHQFPFNIAPKIGDVRNLQDKIEDNIIRTLRNKIERIGLNFISVDVFSSKNKDNNTAIYEIRFVQNGEEKKIYGTFEEVSKNLDGLQSNDSLQT